MLPQSVLKLLPRPFLLRHYNNYNNFFNKNTSCVFLEKEGQQLPFREDEEFCPLKISRGFWALADARHLLVPAERTNRPQNGRIVIAAKLTYLTAALKIF